MAAPPSWIFILLAWFILGCKSVLAQVTTQNPLIWQTLVSPYSSNNFDYVSDSTNKYYSQDFQTVFAYNDNNGHNERLLINVGNGCHNLTLDEITSYNNHRLSAFTQRQPVMGLVDRGGGCTWSTKINTMKTLVLHYSNLDMTGVLIYDNVTYDSSSLNVVRLLPSQLLAPNHWNSTTLSPPQRNISNMIDNDLGTLNNNSNYMAVYFVPQAFGQDMLGKMNNTNSHYVMLAPYFSDRSMDDNPSNDNNDSTSTSNPDNGGGTDNLFGYGNRGYIAYLIAAGAAILLAVILFRWCRSPRFGLGRYRIRSLDDPEQQQQQVTLGAYPPLHPHHQQHTSSPPPCIPIEKLDAMCAAQPASVEFPQMKNTICAICLDDFRPASIVRLLPCHHGFCVGCIDFWLTKKSSLCPICKYDCAATNDDNEHDLGKIPNNTTPPPPASSSAATSPSPQQQTTIPLEEHDLGAHTLSPPPTTTSDEPPTRTTMPPPS